MNYYKFLKDFETLSLALFKLRKIDLTNHCYIHDAHLLHLFKNCKLLDEAILLDCYGITNDGIASALRKRPTLKSLCFSSMLNPTYITSNFSDSLASLKSLTSLDFLSFDISNELLSSIAITGLPLRRLVFQDCIGYSYAGIILFIIQVSTYPTFGSSKCQFFEGSTCCRVVFISW
ncbi:F-box/LRR-repeat protein [Trifolium repens]|nr:F-box/LRR-repeat protein [Trifolium repens]